ncbi:hypothetical protein H1C71_028932, partial [Ictidomys tridecemlineatus]
LSHGCTFGSPRCLETAAAWAPPPGIPAHWLRVGPRHQFSKQLLGETNMHVNLSEKRLPGDPVPVPKKTCAPSGRRALSGRESTPCHRQTLKQCPLGRCCATATGSH